MEYLRNQERISESGRVLDIYRQVFAIQRPPAFTFFKVEMKPQFDGLSNSNIHDVKMLQ